MNVKIKIRNVIIAVCLMATIFIVLDWSRLTINSTDYIEPYPLSKILKLATSFLCAFLAWTIGEKHITSLDAKKLKVAFSIIFVGDLSFTISGLIRDFWSGDIADNIASYFSMAGVIIFALGQVAMVYRNSKNIFKFLKDPKESEDRRYLVVVALIILIVDFIMVRLVFYKSIGLIIYSLFLCLSVWMAFAALKIDYFSVKNSHLIAIGMVLFFLCDFTVGGGMLKDAYVIGDRLPKEIYTSFTWMFYSPALLLLSISGYRFDQ